MVRRVSNPLETNERTAEKKKTLLALKMKGVLSGEYHELKVKGGVPDDGRKESGRKGPVPGKKVKNRRSVSQKGKPPSGGKNIGGQKVSILFSTGISRKKNWGTVPKPFLVRPRPCGGWCGSESSPWVWDKGVDGPYCVCGLWQGIGTPPLPGATATTRH